MKKISNPLFFIMLLIPALIIYFIFGIHMQSDEIPSCTASIKVLGKNNRVAIFDVSVYNTAPHKATFLVLGTIEENGEKYRISRSSNTTYVNKGDYYLFHVTQSHINSGDNIPDEKLNNPLLAKKSGFFFQISKVDNNNLAFMVNSIPVFICTKNTALLPEHDPA